MSDVRPDNQDNHKPYDAVSLVAAQKSFVDGSRRPPRAMKVALSQASTSQAHDSSGNITEEDYDHLKPDPYAIVAGAHGGGFEEHPTTNGKHHLRYPRGRLSIDAQNGDFVLEAPDEDVKDIIKSGLGIEIQSPNPRQKKKFKEIVFTRQFTAFDSHNVESAKSPFHGFFTLFWLGTAIFMTQVAVKNYVAHGNVLGTNEIIHQMRQSDLILLGISDGVLWLTTGFGWALQMMVARGWVRWNREGWIIQHTWQTFYLFAVISWTQNRGWSWSHTIFFVMHCLVMLMKQHSYAFYNGHLSELYKTREELKKVLKVLENKEPAETSSPTTPRLRSPSTNDAPPQPGSRKTMQPTADLADIIEVIESDEPLDLRQLQSFESALKSEIFALTVDLQGKASNPENSYPNNLSLKRHYEFTLLPTLVYELEYPRTDSIDWRYVFEKAAATAGVLFIMQLVSQTFIYPVVMHTVQMKEDGLPVHERLKHFPWMISDLTFPFMMEYMMTWLVSPLPLFSHPRLTICGYVLFESLLNLLAELTYFADRGFYADWWNSVSWDQYARDWNKPVHVFLLRHVYHSSLSSFTISRHVATLITFLLSALVHELLMFVLFKKLRGYLMLMQMSQIPLVQLSRTKWLKGKKTLGNLIFWLGMFTGPSLLCSLYLVI